MINPKPTSAKPITFGNITFRCYRTGISRYQWRSDCGIFAAGRNAGRSTFYAKIGDTYPGTSYRSLEGAMKAAIG